jgi:hypothetical protein
MVESAAPTITTAPRVGWLSYFDEAHKSVGDSESHFLEGKNYLEN